MQPSLSRPCVALVIGMLFFPSWASAERAGKRAGGTGCVVCSHSATGENEVPTHGGVQMHSVSAGTKRDVAVVCGAGQAWLATGKDRKASIWYWEPDSPHAARIGGPYRWVLATAMSRDGKTVAWGVRSPVYDEVWMWRTGDRLPMLLARCSSLADVAVSPDGKAVCWSGTNNGAFVIWAWFQDPDRVEQIGAPVEASDISLFVSDRFIGWKSTVVSGANQTWLWNRKLPEQPGKARVFGRMEGWTASGDGETIAWIESQSESGPCRVWRWGKGETEPRSIGGPYRYARDLNISHDGTQAAWVAGDKEMEGIWYWTSGGANAQLVFGCSEAIGRTRMELDRYAIAWDSQVGNGSREVRLWRPQGHKPQLIARRLFLRDMLTTRSGNALIVSKSNDGSLTIWLCSPREAPRKLARPFASIANMREDPVEERVIWHARNRNGREAIWGWREGQRTAQLLGGPFAKILASATNHSKGTIAWIAQDAQGARLWRQSHTEDAASPIAELACRLDATMWLAAERVLICGGTDDDRYAVWMWQPGWEEPEQLGESAFFIDSVFVDGHITFVTWKATAANGDQSLWGWRLGDQTSRRIGGPFASVWDRHVERSSHVMTWIAKMQDGLCSVWAWRNDWTSAEELFSLQRAIWNIEPSPSVP